MKLAKLVAGIGGNLIQGDLDIDICKITIDSRRAKRGTLFVCIQGFNTDGHNYIESAVRNGCDAVICERDVDNLPEGVTAYRVDNSREVLAKMASKLYDEPSKKFNLIGVTGTNGKTSTTYFMEEVLKAYNHKTGVVGTVEIRIGNDRVEMNLATSTTPDTVELNELLSQMADKSVDDVIMEVSSHGLELKKVDCLDFDIGIFTNLTQDHLDFHGTMENYCRAKAKLFKMCKYGIINADDKWCDKIISEADCEITTFGIENECDIRAKNIEYLMDRVKFDVEIDGIDVNFELKVAGKFSVYNALGVIGAALAMGIPIDIIKKGIENIKGVPGRIQSIPNDKGFNVIVDYAHTPDGLENILNAVKVFTKGNIITVFGCGGDRDRTKRPIMGEIAAKLSNYCVVTSDNPRSEEPIDILKDIEAGVKPLTDKYELISDRREGIYKAVRLAKPGDTVVIAGKGHEDYEIFKDKTIHFDDVEVASEALEEPE